MISRDGQPTALGQGHRPFRADLQDPAHPAPGRRRTLPARGQGPVQSRRGSSRPGAHDLSRPQGRDDPRLLRGHGRPALGAGIGAQFASSCGTPSTRTAPSPRCEPADTRCSTPMSSDCRRSCAPTSASTGTTASTCPTPAEFTDRCATRTPTTTSSASRRVADDRSGPDDACRRKSLLSRETGHGLHLYLRPDPTNYR